jgi:flagellar hook-length control protein FliK
VQASPNPAASADAKSNNTSLLRQLNNARAANSNRSPVAAEHARATVPPESGVRSGTTPASQPPLPNATEQAQSATGRLSSEGLVLSPGRDMNRGTPDASDYNQAEESDRLTGKELPESGKPLPSVLTHSPAQFAPGLADRVEQMTRRVGIGRQKLAILDGKETAASDRLTSEGLRLPTTELFSRLMSQAHPLAPAGEAVLVTQSSAPDSQTTQSSQAASLLASVQASAERSSTSRPTPLTGLDSGNGFSVHIQPDSLEWSNQLGNRIRWMSNLNLSSAELKLYPAELGTLEIHIASEDDQARVSFITSNAAAKEIIESSLPRLRELLGQSGLLLEQGDVTYRDSGTGDSRERVPAGNGSFAAADRVQTEAAELSLPLYRRSASENRIDQFA